MVYIARMPITDGLTVPGSFLRISEKVGDEPFAPRDVEPILGRGMKTYGELARLAKLGWLFRVGRGRYATVDPLVRLTPGAERGIARYRSRCWYPVLQRAVGGILRTFSRRLGGVVLFGSMARGMGGRDSDIDLLLFVDRRPRSAYEEVRSKAPAVASCEPLAEAEYERSGHLHRVQLVLAVEEAFDRPGLLLPDVVEDGVILFDPDRIVARGFALLRRRFRENGVRRVTLPGGATYWENPLLAEA